MRPSYPRLFLSELQKSPTVGKEEEKKEGRKVETKIFHSNISKGFSYSFFYEFYSLSRGKEKIILVPTLRNWELIFQFHSLQTPSYFSQEWKHLFFPHFKDIFLKIAHFTINCIWKIGRTSAFLQAITEMNHMIMQTTTNILVPKYSSAERCINTG